MTSPPTSPTPLPSLSPDASPLETWLSQQPETHIKLGLDRMHHALALLGNPHLTVPVIHVAGTNGKGSTAKLLQGLLMASGLTVGLYTSPHLSCITERFLLNHTCAPSHDLDQYVHIIQKKLGPLPKEEQPTYFERLTLLAFTYYATVQPDVLILETGLGGRFDATNVCPTPLLSIITHIGLDHTDLLGETFAQIAREKAGIIKELCPVIQGAQSDESIVKVIESTATKLNAPVVVVPSGLYRIKALPATVDISTGLLPSPSSQFTETTTGNTLITSPKPLPTYQTENIATAITAFQTLVQHNAFPQLSNLSESETNTITKAGLASFCWPARFEWFSEQRTVLDGSHNADGFQWLAQNLRDYFPDTPIQWIISLQARKPLEPLLDMLALFNDHTKQVLWTNGPTDSPFAFHPLPNNSPKHWRLASSPEEAFEQSTPETFKGITVITGSLHTAGKLRPFLIKTS